MMASSVAVPAATRATTSIASGFASSGPGQHTPSTTPGGQQDRPPPPAFTFRKPHFGQVWQRATDARNWSCYVLVFAMVFVISLIVFVAAKPSFLMQQTSEGLATDQIHFVRTAAVSGLFAAAAVGLGLWMNGIPKGSFV